MKKRNILILLLFIVVGLFWYLGFFESKKNKDPKILVFSKTTGFRHESIEAGIEAIQKLGKEHHFEVVTSEDANTFREDFLKDFNVIVFLNTTLDILNLFQQSQMERFIQAGGGFVGIHSAADTEYDWQWYGKLVGAYFDSHPNNPNVRNAVLQVVNSNHSSTDSLPEKWQRHDEWYNYKSINPNINILIKLDESTYEGGTNGENHPIAWYHEYDGGRAFYTGLGHTIKSYTEPLFIKHILGGIHYAIGSGAPLDYSKAYSEPIPQESRFVKVTLDEGLNEPMEFDFLSDNEILFIERKGDVKIFDLEKGKTEIIFHFNVFSNLEDGLLGVAVDPNYNKNQWVYFFYSPEGDDPKQRVSRFRLAENQLDTNSEKILLEIPVQRDECCHSAGSLEFDKQGNLFISVGDNTNPHFSDGYTPIDDRKGRNAFDAQKSSSNTNDLRGKILRIKPEKKGIYSIPEGNLFPKDGSQGRPEIYVMGCRNPFRFSIDSRTNYLYWGDIGPDANKDSIGRGVKGYDEINCAKLPGFFGWPYFIADNKPYNYYDFDKKISGEAFDPQNPVNNSSNNTGMQNLPPAQPALIWYPYSQSEEFPIVGSGSRNAMVGPIYHYDEYPENDKKFPQFFDGKLFIYDWMRQWIFAVSFNKEEKIKNIISFIPNMSFNNIIDMAFNSKGELYILEYGSLWFSGNDDARLAKIEYVRGNRKPIAKIETDKIAGKVPLTIKFKGSNSIDYDGDNLTYLWKFNEKEQNEESNPTYTFEKPGIYEVILEVKDPDNKQSADKIQIIAGNEVPKINWRITGANQTFFQEDKPLKINYEVVVNDEEDGSTKQGTIDERRIVLSFYYSPEERGITALQGHQAMAENAMTLIGKNLINNSDCNSCHQIDKKSIGPTFKSIAERYGVNHTDYTNYLSKKIINGGGGVWGETAMAAHPNISELEAKQMVEYIFSLNEKKITKKYPIKGIYQSKEHMEGNRSNGVYMFTASYTDKGGKNVKSLTSSKTILLRNAKIQAEDYDKAENALKFQVKAEDTPLVDEDMEVVVISPKTWFMFKNIDLTEITAIGVRCGIAPNMTKGGKLLIYMNSLKGRKIGEILIEQKMSNYGIKEYKTAITPISERGDIYFIFEPASPQEEGIITAVDWVYFKYTGTSTIY